MALTTTSPARRAHPAQPVTQHPRRVAAPPGRFTELPRVPTRVVPVPSFAHAMDEATRRTLTTVVAPAGMGRTAQLAGWASRRRRTVRWLTARTGEAPTELAHALLAAVGENGIADRAVDPSHVTSRLRRSTALPRVLVVDDAHRLGDEGWALLGAVLDGAPGRVRLVLSTRREVPIPLVGLELAEQLTTLRAGALQLDHDRSAELVRLHAPDLGKSQVERLVDRACGWPAALVLSARRAGTSTPTSGVRRPGPEPTEQPVLDHLLDDALASLSTATRHVLVCLAGEDDVTDAEAVTLTADRGAGARLAELAADGLLVQRRDDDAAHPAWRLHPLLDELLTRRALADATTRDELREAHLRAARHHATHDSPVVALRHATRAEAHELVARLLRLHGTGLVADGHAELVTEALDAMPAPVLRIRPTLRALAARVSHVDDPAAEDAAAPARRGGTRTGEWALVAQPLTEREEDVLGELALGGTYADIARSLLVSENTVKTHVAAIYRKLGADRRGTALRRARELGLL